MRRCRRFITLLLTIIAALFVLNFLVMYIFFNVNVLRYGFSLNSGRNAALKNDIGFTEKSTADFSGTDDPYEASIMNGDCQANGAASEYPEGQNGSNGYFMTQDEITSLKYLSLDNKLAAMVILAKLGMDNADRIYEMSSDGVTIEEFEEIKAIVESELSESDIKTIEKILAIVP